MFKGLPYTTEFIIGDIHTIQLEKQYDIAVCHGVLLHMVNPMNVLEKMIRCVKRDGKIISFEPHWISNNASFYFEGIEQSSAIPLGLLQELFERDAKRTGKDGNIGLKLPLYFNRLGLRDVQCRVSDKVNVLDPAIDKEQASMLYDAMQFSHPGDRDPYVRSLLERGMLPEEAERQYEAESYLSEKFSSSTAATYAAGMKITFGTVS